MGVIVSRTNLLPVYRILRQIYDSFAEPMQQTMTTEDLDRHSANKHNAPGWPRCLSSGNQTVHSDNVTITPSTLQHVRLLDLLPERSKETAVKLIFAPARCSGISVTSADGLWLLRRSATYMASTSNSCSSIAVVSCAEYSSFFYEMLSSSRRMLRSVASVLVSLKNFSIADSSKVSTYHVQHEKLLAFSSRLSTHLSYFCC